MKRVLVLAYCGNNLGDDLFLKILIERYPDVHFDVFCPDWTQLEAFRDHDRVDIVSWSTFRATPQLWTLFVVIGGSMFQEVPRWYLGWLALARRVLLSRRRNIPMAIIGASFGPHHSGVFRRAYELLFRQFRWVSFRDAQSVSLFPRLDARLYPDLAFSEAKSTPPAREGRLIGMSVMDMGAAVNFPEYESSCARLIAELPDTATLRLFAFQEGNGLSDRLAIERVLSEVPINVRARVDVITYDGDVTEFIRQLRECDTFISTRLHSMILSLLSGQRLAVLSYHPKIDHLLETLGIDVAMYPVSDIGHEWPGIASAIVDDALPYPQFADVEAFKSATGHFGLLDTLLKAQT